MQKIQKQIAKIITSGKVGLMTHVVAGCPDMDLSERIIQTMIKQGVDFIEIQIPFSDPVADGPVMSVANEIALHNQTKVEDAFDLAERVCRSTDIPIFFMGYFNAIFKMGIDNFCRQAKKIGIAGLIFPDIPFDEAEKEGLSAAVKKYDLPFIQVVSEITEDQRLRQMSKITTGLVYCVSRFGTTGTGDDKQFSAHLAQFLKKVKKYLNLPLAVGFGVSSKKDVQEIGKHAEVAVVGSAVMKIALDENLSDVQKLKGIAKFIEDLR